MVDYAKRFVPVRTISVKGKILVWVLRLLLRIWRLFAGNIWRYAMDGHHEDPSKMTLKQLVYYTGKYYYKAVVRSNRNRGVETHLHQNSGELQIPEGFAATGNTITITAGGDLMPYACITKESTEKLWDEAGPFFFSADIVTANLETPVDISAKTGLVPEVMINHMFFNGNEEMFDVFSGHGKYKGYDLLSTANNHSFDMGEQGLRNTIDFLEKKNILFTGTARSEEERDQIPVVERNGIRIAFLSFTFTLNTNQLPAGKTWLCNHLNLNETDVNIALIRDLTFRARNANADIVVAFLHMGVAYQPYPSAEIMDNMHRICRETGIDVLLGGHPHNTQPMEFLNVQDPFTGEQKQSFIIYSQGDFIAWDIFKWCHLPLILKFTISEGTLNGKRKVQLTAVEGRLYYMQAEVSKGKITGLRLRDLRNLRQDRSQWPADRASADELEEIFDFADTFLLPGNLEKIVDTGKK